MATTSSGSLKSGNALTLTSGTADFANAGQTLGAVSNANTATNALNFSATTGTVTLASLSGAGNTRFGSNGTVTGGIATGTVTSVGALNANISGGTVTAGGLLTGTISNGTVGAGSLSSSSISGGTNTITGAAGITTLSNGTTTVGGVATIGTMSAGTANLNGATSAISTLNGGTVNLGSSTVLTVNDGTTSGSITGSGGLTKDTSGTLTLSSASTYAGATTVNAGTLKVSGSIANSAVTVNNSGTVLTSGTTGTIGKSVTVNNGAILAAGGQNTIGTATVGSDGLSFASGSIFEWDLATSKDANGTGGNDGVGGADFDSVSVGGNLSADPTGAIFKVIFGTTALADITTPGNAFWNTPNGTQTWNMSAIFGKAFNTNAFTVVQTSTRRQHLRFLHHHRQCAHLVRRSRAHQRAGRCVSSPLACCAAAGGNFE